MIIIIIYLNSGHVGNPTMDYFILSYITHHKDDIQTFVLEKNPRELGLIY